MEAIGMVLLLAVFASLVAPWVALVRLRALGVQEEELNARVGALQEAVLDLRRELNALQPLAEPEPVSTPGPVASVTPDAVVGGPEAVSPRPARVIPPPLPSTARAAAAVPSDAATEAAPGEAAAAADAVPEPLPEPSAPRPAFIPPLPRPLPSSRPALDWEQFMGVKMLAWLGGLAFFLGMAYVVKYSFEHNWISPAMRVTAGFVTGLGLIGGGLLMRRKAYEVMSHTLCATGVVTLYAVTFASHAIYHFPFFQVIPTFAIMALITASAFLLAARMDAMVVAILGMLGGFLTPVIVHSGQDNPLGLFGYLAVLDTGLLAIGLRRRWHFLLVCAAVGTAAMQWAWIGEFFTPAKIGVPAWVFPGFGALFLGGAAVARRLSQRNVWTTAAVVIVAFATFAFCFQLLGIRDFSARPGVLFGFVAAADLCLLVLVLIDESASVAQHLGGGVAFLLLGLWTLHDLNPNLLVPALGLYLAFAFVHGLFPLALERLRPGARAGQAVTIFPLLAMGLMLLPLVMLREVGWVLWPAILVLDCLAVAVAVITLSLGSILIATVITFVAAGLWIMRFPLDVGRVDGIVGLLAGFAVFFFVVGLVLRRWATRHYAGRGQGIPGAQLALILPAYSSAMPFLLLMMATGQIPMANPSMFFGLALALSGMLLAAAWMFELPWIPLIALGCTAAEVLIWKGTAGGRLSEILVPLCWCGGFGLVFAAFPFVRRDRWDRARLVWISSALAWPAFFLPVYHLVVERHPAVAPGLVPAVFLVPSAVALVARWCQLPGEHPDRNQQLAWYGGAALLFLTLIFPIQFHRQWITLGWALEGVALLAFFHRVPHPGLRRVGVGLLVAAFVRLALNPAVLAYHARAATPVFNWYLYTYGLVTACLVLGGWLMGPRRGRAPGSWSAVVALNTLAAVLGFILLNIEIADYFTPVGQGTLTFDFTGNFARDMSYSIGWAMYALVLLGIGLSRRVRPARLAGVSLMGVTLAKLFLHDLARLDSLYRVGALIGVAILALASSFLYQRFLAVDEAAPGPDPAGTGEPGTPE
jgi:uncharacterized membrane protein